MNLQVKSREELLNSFINDYTKIIKEYLLIKIMSDKKPLLKAPYDIKDVSVLFAIVAFILIIAAIAGNNLFGLFQKNINFG